MRPSIVVISTLPWLAATTADVQQTAPANTPYIAPTGKTVPRPADLPSAGSAGRDPYGRSEEERKADGLTRGICQGC